MKRSITYKSIIGFLGICLLFSYQNCSKVTSGLDIHDNSVGLVQSYTVDPPQTSAANGDIDVPALPSPAGSGIPDGPVLVDPPVVVNHPPVTNPPVVNPPVVNPPVVSAPPPQAPPPTENPGTGQTPPPVVQPPVVVVPPVIPIENCVMRPQPVEGVENHVDANSQALNFCKDNEGPKDDSEEVNEAIKLCKQDVSLATSQDFFLDAFHGQLAIKVMHVKQISNLVGALFLKAASENSSIDLINKIRSSNEFKTDRAVVLCGFKEVKLLENIRGHIILVNSHVSELRDHVGRLTLVNSKIDKTERQGGGIVNIYESKK